ncbi:MAG: toll/interleukin-1 receptor domain-containing protein [Bacteroidales bacterium]|nr:toll/interleukin-1 receptor domain-containing protein [Bacteroidales bacterium]
MLNKFNVLTEQIESAKKLIERADAIPDAEPSNISTDKVMYNEEYTQPLADDTNAWKMETSSYLNALYGYESRQSLDFQKYTRFKNQYIDFRKDIKDEIKLCIAYLDSLIKVNNMEQQTKEQLNGVTNMSPMVFISHSTDDKNFAEALVELLESLGLNNTNLFCSSVCEYGIRLSSDIYETLRDLFSKHKLFVIFIHSPRYYKSPISLNEMGVAWFLKTDFCSFLTTDMEFSDMKGVVKNDNISIKVNAEDAKDRLTQLKEKLIKVFELKDIDSITWERKRKSFFDKVLSFEYSTKDIAEESINTFSQDELQIFSKWANNEVDDTYVTQMMREGLVVHFGYQNGYTFSRGKAMAEFEDFMQRLLDNGYIKISSYDKYDQKIYKITKQGYAFAKTLIEK